jgi:hypothetical protein
MYELILEGIASDAQEGRLITKALKQHNDYLVIELKEALDHC